MKFNKLIILTIIGLLVTLPLVSCSGDDDRPEQEETEENDGGEEAETPEEIDPEDGGAITINTSKTEAEGLESKATLAITGGNTEITAYEMMLSMLPSTLKLPEEMFMPTMLPGTLKLPEEMFMPTMR